MKGIISSIRNKIIYFKICLGRAVNYLNIVNSGMILYLFLSSLKDKGYINWELSNYLPIIFFLSLFGLVIVGFIEIKFFKGMQEEATISNKLNPYFMEMKEKIDKICEKLDIK